MIYQGVAIAGKAGAGKNTLATEVAKELVRRGLWPTEVAFAQGVKDELWKTRGMKKEDPGGRAALVEIGDGRRREDPDYWVKAMAERVGSLIPCGAIPIVTDVRYSNELNWCRAAYFLTVRVDATGMDRAVVLAQRGEDPDFAYSDTPSEVDLDEAQYDIRFWNPHGSYTVLPHMACLIADKLQGLVTESAA